MWLLREIVFILIYSLFLIRDLSVSVKRYKAITAVDPTAICYFIIHTSFLCKYMMKRNIT